MYLNSPRRPSSPCPILIVMLLGSIVWVFAIIGIVSLIR